MTFIAIAITIAITTRNDIYYYYYYYYGVLMLHTCMDANGTRAFDI